MYSITSNGRLITSNGRLIDVHYSGSWTALRLLWQTGKGARRDPVILEVKFVYITEQITTVKFLLVESIYKKEVLVFK